jgi:virginiamycin A acetyltransferase
MQIRKTIKTVISWIAICCVAPLGISERLARHILKRDVWFESVGDLLSLIPGKVGSYLRNAYYWMTLKRCPLDCCFIFGMSFTHSDASVGHRVYIGAHSMVGIVSIGDDTLLGDHVHVLSGKQQHSFHDPDRLIREQPQVFRRIHIGSNCWIGTNCVVMADIGKNCVIGAGSVVTKSVPHYLVAAGNPARILRPMKARDPEVVFHEAIAAQQSPEL